MKPTDIDILKEIARFEATVAESEYPLGWCWRQVRVWPSTLNKLVIEGLLEVTFSSNSYTGYRLTENGKIAASGDLLTEPSQISVDLPKIPADLFTLIEGYDDIKDLVQQVLQADKPVHLLLTGVPSSAKTMFLMELAQVPGAVYILGSQATRAGIAETLFDLKPDILLVDEIDRIGTRDIAILLSLAETGIVVETKHARRREIRLNTKIFAASNTLNMPQELISRFMVLTFKPYLKEEFLKVACAILLSREQVNPNLALYIAQKVYQLSPSPDPRQVVRVARLAKSVEEVDKVLDIITRYTS